VETARADPQERRWVLLRIYLDEVPVPHGQLAPGADWTGAWNPAVVGEPAGRVFQVRAFPYDDETFEQLKRFGAGSLRYYLDVQLQLTNWQCQDRNMVHLPADDLIWDRVENGATVHLRRRRPDEVDPPRALVGRDDLRQQPHRPQPPHRGQEGIAMTEAMEICRAAKVTALTSEFEEYAKLCDDRAAEASVET
jgi:hypothetical protein